MQVAFQIMAGHVSMRVLSNIKHTQWTCRQNTKPLDHAFKTVVQMQVWLWYSGGRSPADKSFRMAQMPSSAIINILHAGMSKVCLLL